MNSRRLCAFLLGAWLLGSVFAALVAVRSFALADRILASPPKELAGGVRQLGSEIARQLLRFQAAELNRTMFGQWQLVQLLLAAVLTGVAVASFRHSQFFVGATVAMLLIVLTQIAVLTPSMNRWQRAFEFAAPKAAVYERSAFAQYHGFFAAGEVLKIGLGIGLAGLLLFERSGKKASGSSCAGASTHRRRRRTGRDKVKAIDNADDGHIDR